jgi:alpha-glucosidase
VASPQGEPYVFPAPNGTSSHPDFTRDETKAYVVAALKKMVEVYGFDGWMADFGEWTPLDAVHASGVDPAEAHNLFPVWWHAANRAAMDEVRPDGDWVTIARSGWTGVQRHTMIHWVGDQEATWDSEDGLATVVPAMLNLGFAGVPYVTLDIGGFSGGPSTKELYMRWVELGAFAPVMRTHEGNRRDENHNWDTDEETLVHFRRFARIHQALGPVWEGLADEADASSVPMIRALVLHYPEDMEARGVSDQFLIGEDLLVAPVVTEGAVEAEVYLPEGQWFHVFTGESFSGPQRVTVAAPIGTPPVFSRGVDRPDLRAIE